MLQAASDYRAAQRLDTNDPTTWCQAISKYQQCVEKSMKGVLHRPNEARVTNHPFKGRHEVAQFAEVFAAAPQSRDSRALLNRLTAIFNEDVVQQVRALDALVPAYPKQGERTKRNHEYPFEESASGWRAPAERETFGEKEMRGFRRCAGRLMNGLPPIVEALDLLFE